MWDLSNNPRLWDSAAVILSHWSIFISGTLTPGYNWFPSDLLVQGLCPGTLSRDSVQALCPGTLSRHSVQALCPGTLSRDSVQGLCPGTLSRHSVQGLCPGTLSRDSVQGLCVWFVWDYVMDYVIKKYISNRMTFLRIMFVITIIHIEFYKHLNVAWWRGMNVSATLRYSLHGGLM